jgi:hypothetical protein
MRLNKKKLVYGIYYAINNYPLLYPDHSLESFEMRIAEMQIPCVGVGMFPFAWHFFTFLAHDPVIGGAGYNIGEIQLPDTPGMAPISILNS